MLNVKIIAVGNLKEPYLRDAASEYEKRLSAFCSLEIVQIKEARLPDSPSESEIAAALAEEGGRIAAAIPPRAYTFALCVEGGQMTSHELADELKDAAQCAGAVCFIIGGSHGLAEEIKAVSRKRLSLSRLTFPHQLTRVILLETVYRSFNIIKGTKYHK